MGNWYEVLAFLEKFHILKNIDFIEFLFQQKVKDRAHTREVTKNLKSQRKRRSVEPSLCYFLLIFKNKKTETLSFRFFIRYDRRYEASAACAVQQSLIAQADLMNQ